MAETAVSNPLDGSLGARRPRVTAPAIAARKGGEPPIVMVTAYDAPSARICDAAGVDVILVGDSLANVVLGYDDTLQVTIEDLDKGQQFANLEGDDREAWDRTWTEVKAA